MCVNTAVIIPILYHHSTTTAAASIRALGLINIIITDAFLARHTKQMSMKAKVQKADRPIERTANAIKLVACSSDDLVIERSIYVAQQCNILMTNEATLM